MKPYDGTCDHCDRGHVRYGGLICADCWRLVPGELRHALNAAVRARRARTPGSAYQYRIARDACTAALRAHVPAAAGGEQNVDRGRMETAPATTQENRPAAAGLT